MPPIHNDNRHTKPELDQHRDHPNGGQTRSSSQHTQRGAPKLIQEEWPLKTVLFSLSGERREYTIITQNENGCALIL
jgi:hypothetical protein